MLFRTLKNFAGLFVTGGTLVSAGAARAGSCGFQARGGSRRVLYPGEADVRRGTMPTRLYCILAALSGGGVGRCCECILRGWLLDNWCTGLTGGGGGGSLLSSFGSLAGGAFTSASAGVAGRLTPMLGVSACTGGGGVGVVSPGTSTGTSVGGGGGDMTATGVGGAGVGGSIAHSSAALSLGRSAGGPGDDGGGAAKGGDSGGGPGAGEVAVAARASAMLVTDIMPFSLIWSCTSFHVSSAAVESGAATVSGAVVACGGGNGSFAPSFTVHLTTSYIL